MQFIGWLKRQVFTLWYSRSWTFEGSAGFNRSDLSTCLTFPLKPMEVKVFKFWQIIFFILTGSNYISSSWCSKDPRPPFLSWALFMGPWVWGGGNVTGTKENGCHCNVGPFTTTPSAWKIMFKCPEGVLALASQDKSMPCHVVLIWPHAFACPPSLGQVIHWVVLWLSAKLLFPLLSQLHWL